MGFLYSYTPRGRPLRTRGRGGRGFNREFEQTLDSIGRVGRRWRAHATSYAHRYVTRKVVAYAFGAISAGIGYLWGSSGGASTTAVGPTKKKFKKARKGRIPRHIHKFNRKWNTQTVHNHQRRPYRGKF